ncbi:MAG: hypothetical protein HC812_10595 [Leptolyngbya sp. RL_3_1]|nr:hypothetical protein [Leptolyngbya sp. RL_3_1]
MVERPIKKAELAKRREAEAAEGGGEPRAKENRGDRGDRKERGKGGRGKGRDRGGEPRAAMNPALMRGPKPNAKVAAPEVAAVVTANIPDVEAVTDTDAAMAETLATETPVDTPVIPAEDVSAASTPPATPAVEIPTETPTVEASTVETPGTPAPATAAATPASDIPAATPTVEASAIETPEPSTPATESEATESAEAPA